MLTLDVVVISCTYRLAATDREHFVRSRKIQQIFGHFVCHLLVWMKSFGFHLSHDTLDNMPVLQRQERDEEVHQVIGNQT